MSNTKSVNRWLHFVQKLSEVLMVKGFWGSSTNVLSSSRDSSGMSNLTPICMSLKIGRLGISITNADSAA